MGILSPAALGSDYVQLEWQNTVTGDVSGQAAKLLLVRVADCLPDGIYSRIGFLDLVDVPEENAEEVFLKGLRGSGKSAKDAVYPTRRPLQHKPFLSGQFAGRRTQLERLQTAIRLSAAQGNSIGLYGLRGMGGVGKSRLAAELADRLSTDTGLFPGGVLWCNLMEETAETAARKWLKALEADGTTPDPSALYETLRQTIACRRPLIVCDNVQHPGQGRGNSP